MDEIVKHLDENQLALLFEIHLVCICLILVWPFKCLRAW